MAKVTAYYSASEKDIIAVVGDGLEEGNMAICTGGCKALGAFDTKEKAVEGLKYLEDDLNKMGFIGFLIHGGGLNASAAVDMPAEGYEVIGTFEIEG